MRLPRGWFVACAPVPPLALLDFAPDWMVSK